MCNSFDDFLFDCPVYPPKGQKVCLICGSLYVGNGSFCSTKCNRDARLLQHRLANGWETKPCKRCKTLFFGDSTTCYCSAECRKKQASCTRTAAVRGMEVVEEVNVIDLYAKQQGKCLHCGKQMKISGNMRLRDAATIDHIIPVSKGGWHVVANCRLLCRRCNAIRGNRGFDEEDQSLMSRFDLFNVKSQ